MGKEKKIIIPKGDEKYFQYSNKSQFSEYFKIIKIY